MKRVAFVGTRPHDPRRADSCPADAWTMIEEDVLRTLFAVVHKHGHIVIVTGGATGVDTIAEDFARRHRLSRIVHVPDYDGTANKRAAPCIRNQLIVNDCEVMLAWPKPSREGGTEDAIRKMTKKNAAGLFVREPWRTP